MIDLGQYRTAQEIRDAAQGPRASWASQAERDLRNKAIETDSESDWAAYHAMRDARLTGKFA